MIKSVQTIVDEVRTAIESVSSKEISDLINAIKTSNRIFVSGEGRSGFVGRCFVVRLMHLGFNVYFVGETVTPSMGNGDILIAISGSGTSPYIKADCSKAKKVKANIYAISTNKNNELVNLSDNHLIIPVDSRANMTDRSTQQLMGSLFDQTLHLVLDAVCLEISNKEKIDNETATRSHW